MRAPFVNRPFSRSLFSTTLRLAGLILATLFAKHAGASENGPDPASPDEVTFAPWERGDVGVFQLSRVFPAQNAPGLPPIDTRFTAAWNRMATIDLNKPRAHSDAVAFLKVDLVAKEKGHYVAMLGVDDGVTVLVDKKPVYARDEARPYREDDDFVPLDLDAGRHTIVFRLHQRDGAWLFHARFVGADLRASSALSFRFPRALVKTEDLLALSSVTFDRGLGFAGLHPHLHIEFPAGLPQDVDVPIRATIANSQTPYFPR